MLRLPLPVFVKVPNPKILPCHQVVALLLPTLRLIGVTVSVLVNVNILPLPPPAARPMAPIVKELVPAPGASNTIVPAAVLFCSAALLESCRVPDVTFTNPLKVLAPPRMMAEAVDGEVAPA